MASLMKDIFRQDFFEARQTEKTVKDALINYQISKKKAVDLLSIKMEYIRRDIANMDDNAWKKLKDKLVDLDQKCKEKQNEFKATYEEPDDPIEQDNYSENLAYEKLKRLSAELKFVQRLAFDKGWLE